MPTNKLYDYIFNKGYVLHKTLFINRLIYSLYVNKKQYIIDFDKNCIQTFDHSKIGLKVNSFKLSERIIDKILNQQEIIQEVV